MARFNGIETTNGCSPDGKGYYFTFVFYNSDKSKEAIINLDNLMQDPKNKGNLYPRDQDNCKISTAFSAYHAPGLVGVSAWSGATVNSKYSQSLYEGGNLIVDPYSTVALRVEKEDNVAIVTGTALFGGDWPFISSGYDSANPVKIRLTESEISLYDQIIKTYTDGVWQNPTNSRGSSSIENGKIQGKGQSTFIVDGGGAERTTENIAMYLTANAGATSGTELSDHLGGSSKDDNMFGRSSADIMYGGRGEDNLRGGEGGDLMVGGKGKDRIAGHRGRDWIEGGKGSDEIHPGAQRDTIFWSEFDGKVDTIVNYNPKKDKLGFALSALKGFREDTFFKNNNLQINRTGEVAGNGPRFIFSQDEGLLSYFSGSEQGGLFIKVARLDNAPILDSFEFY